MNKRMCIRLFACGSALAAMTIGSFAWGGNGKNITYFNDPGYMEFSGRMTALPLDNETAQRFADSQLLNDRLIEYRFETGEYIFYIPSGMNENEVSQLMMGTGNFEYVEPDWVVYPLANCPNDSRFGSQWHHTAMDSCDGWDFHTAEGSNVSVGICDTGVKTTHEDLTNFRLEGYNAVNRKWESDGGQISDINGHGTWTTGCAAAQGNNGRGVSGMGWELKHRMLRVTNSSGGGAYMSDLTHAALTSVQNGDFVASVSYSGVTSSSVETTGKSIMDNYGGLLCWAAGNEGRKYDNGDHPHVIIVGATSSGGGKSSFSNYGKFIDVMAPGSSIFTTDRSSNSSYGSVSGTSFSTPLTAGLCALIKSADSSLGPYEVQDILFSGARDMGNPDLYGYGEINVFGSLSMVDSLYLWVDPDPLINNQNATFYVERGDASTETGLFYSLRGTGSTYNAYLGVTLELDRAKQAGGYQYTNSLGNTWWTLHIPKAGKNRLLWLQAAQSSGRLSNVILTQIN